MRVLCYVRIRKDRIVYVYHGTAHGETFHHQVIEVTRKTENSESNPWLFGQTLNLCAKGWSRELCNDVKQVQCDQLRPYC